MQTEQQRIQALWDEQRREISKARYAFEEEQRRNGDGFLKQPPLPASPPEWFLQTLTPDGTVTEIEGEVRGQPKRNPDGTFEIELPAGVLGRPGPSPHLDEPSPAEVFGDAPSGFRKRLKEAVGRRQ